MGTVANAFHWAEEHPVPTTVGVLVVGLGLYLLLNSGGGGSSSGDSSAAAAYYAAESAQGVAGDQLQQTQIAANASVAENASNNATSITNNNTWASTDLAETQSNNATSVSLAPYATENNLIGALASALGLAPTTTVKQSGSSNSGFFGIGASNSKTTTTTTTANPASVAASNELSQLLNGFNPMHG